MYTKIKRLSNHTKLHGKRKWVALAVLLVVLAGAGAVLYANKRDDQKKQTSTHIPTTRTGQSAKGSSKQSSATNPPKTPDSDKVSPQATALVAPSGSFVSNHRPSLSGSPLLRQEESVCTTTPGASCYILFMKDGVAKQLDPQVADSRGSAYWQWDVSQAGLTQGNWKITAVAELNGKRLSTDDGLSLEVQP